MLLYYILLYCNKYIEFKFHIAASELYFRSTRGDCGVDVGYLCLTVDTIVVKSMLCREN